MPVWAQTAITPEQQYKNLIRVDQSIHPLGPNPFGEQIGLYGGSLSFRVTDVSASGNGPLLELTRAFKLQARGGIEPVAEPVFADWTLDLPRIETFAIYDGFLSNGGAQNVPFSGWRVGFDASDISDLRCAHFETPPASVATLPRAVNASYYQLGSWWTGYHLIIPGEGEHDLLANEDQATKGTYPTVTKNHWRLSCINETQTANGQPGDGFIAHAPDGTSYYFNELVYSLASQVPSSMATIVPGPTADRWPSKGWLNELTHPRALVGDVIALLSGSTMAHAEYNGQPSDLGREMAYLLVTKIEDRFGNTLTYQYDANGKLTDIIASDGRHLTINYSATSGDVTSVVLQPASGSQRTWTYSYATVDAGSPLGPRTSLSTVTFPDGSQWNYQFAGFDDPPSLAAGGATSCNTVGAPYSLGPVIASITAPSGLTGTFTVKSMEHARSYARSACNGPPGIRFTGDTPGTWASNPRAWYDYTLTQRSISGAGVPSRTWAYTYSDPNPSWADCTGPCPTTQWTKVERPDGSVVKRTFSNKYDYSESHLLQTDFYVSTTATTPVRSVINTYVDPDADPDPFPLIPTSAGGLLTPRNNSDQAIKYSPLSEREIDQDGDTYTWQAEAFNTYVQVTKEKRFNSIAGQTPVEETTSYLNDTTNWVLGLPTSDTNLTTGETVNQYSYNTDDLLTSRSHFGQPVMTYTWDSAGQLASFTDADSHTTTLSNYKRGIPQTIVYPVTTYYDAAEGQFLTGTTSQSLTVDDLGQITSITDQAGHTTDYAYDAVGRLTQITYPTGWNPETFQYQYVTSAERGLGGGHWDRTVSQGNARHVTYYDALLRPVLTDTYINGDSGSHISAATTYDWKGLTTFASWPVAGSRDLSAITAGTTTTYDALGRATAVSEPSELPQGTLTTTTAYLSGARKQVTDPAGNVTTLSYQVFDQPSYKAVTEVQAPEGIVQSITRDLYGNPTAITQSGPNDEGGTVSVTKQLYYNPQHRLCRTQEPETGSTLYTYDDAGNLVGSAEGLTVSGDGCGTLPGSHITRTYDAMNRLTGVTYPADQRTTTTTYTALGQVHTAASSATNGSTLWTYSYDTLGHLTDETLGVDGYSWPMDYAYDANGALRQITYPDGKNVAYAPDALGRPTQAGTYATGVSYFPDGALEHFVFGNGTDYLATRNDRKLLSNLTYADGSTLEVSRDYTYDKDANVTAINDLVGSDSKTLTYDALNRLTAADATGLWGTATYGYDALNNLRQLTSDGLSRTYQYDASNRLTSITNGGTTLHSFAYDPAGDITQMDSQSRVFDDAHRLLQIPGKASYAYDAAGRRVKATDTGGHATYSVYSRAGQLMYRWATATDTKTDFVYLGKKLLAEVATAPQPPASAPTLSVPASDPDGNYTVSWDSVTDATSYTLEEQTNGGSWSTAYSGASLSQAITGKGNGNYGYRVEACNVAGCSAWSGTQTVVVTHSPGSAPSLTVPSSSNNGSYTVSWSSVGTATSYTLQEEVNASGNWSTVYSGGNLSDAISGKGNDIYGYRVQACNAGGCGNWSGTGTITVLLRPAVPSGPSVPATSNNGSYTVSWSTVATATSYTLEEQTNGGSWSTAYSGAGLSKAESGKGNGSYGYRVQACNTSGCSGWSGTQTVYVLLAPSLSAPSADNDGSYTVSWSSVSTATSYTLEEQANGGSWSTAYSGSSLSKAVSGKGNGSYGYRVEACRSGGCSGWSTEESVAVTHPPASAPSLSVPSSDHDGSYTVSWGSVGTATSYTLQEQTNGGGWSTAYMGGSLSKAISGKSDGSYGYRVEACNAGGCGPWSATHTVSETLYPPVPGNVHYTETGTKFIIVRLHWDTVSTATYYEVEANGSGTPVNVGTATSYELGSYPFNDPSPTLYYGQVRACNSNGCSAWVQ